MNIFVMGRGVENRDPIELRRIQDGKGDEGRAVFMDSLGKLGKPGETVWLEVITPPPPPAIVVKDSWTSIVAGFLLGVIVAAGLGLLAMLGRL